MKLMIVALLVAGAYGCGVPTFPPSTSRVVGGVDVRENSWPWQVSLQYDLSGFHHSCGATLLSEEWIMTAAHCITSGRIYKVYLGKHSLKDDEAGSEFISVAKVIYHPKWVSSRGIYDLAMLKLRTPVTFSDSIKPACLPKFEQILPHDTPCYVTGWGRLSTNGAGADILQQALLPIVEHATCKKNDWWSFMVTDKMVCAGGDGERSGCFGDSGGPLNCQNPDGSWAVHGVFSFGSGQGCNVVKKPSVFTRISTFVDWIEDILNPPKPDGCGVPTFPPSTSRVVGGVDVREHSWPWQVSLQYDLSGFHHSCGATLLSEEWIMTAAHCITSGRIYKVYLGKHSLKDDEAGSKFISVAKVIYHPKWVSSRGINDLAMLKLRTPVTFSDSIKPACLPKFEQILPHDTPCYVTGWGRLSTNGDNTDILQQALLPIVEHATCKKNDWWSFMVTDKMVCAGGDGERSGCFGDSGGPLNCQNPDGSWVVHGVFSFGSGQGCNVVKKPSVYTRTSAYVDWINRIMTQH